MHAGPRINRVLRVMLHTHWSAEAWAQVRVEFKKTLALRSEIRYRRCSPVETILLVDDEAETLATIREMLTGRIRLV